MVLAAPTLSRSRPASALSGSSSSSRLPPPSRVAHTSTLASSVRSPTRPAHPTTPARAGRAAPADTGTAKRVESVGPSTAREATRVVSGASATKTMAAKSEGGGDKTALKPGRVLLSAGPAPAAGSGAGGTVKAASKAPLSRSVSGGQLASKPSTSALAPSNSLRQFPTTTPSKRRAPHSSSDSSNLSELGLASPSVHRTPRVRTLALATPVRPPPLDSPTTVRPIRSLAASLPTQAPATARRPPSSIGRGPPPACATTARKVSTALKSSTSLQRSTQTPPRVPSQPKSLPPSTLRAARPPPLKRPTTASSIPISAAKNVRTLKKATPSPSIGGDDDEADDERATARSVRSRSTSLAKENVGLGLSAGGTGKGKESAWDSIATSTRPAVKELAPTRTTIRPAPTKEASLRPHPYHRPHLPAAPVPSPAPAPAPVSAPHIHLSKASITALDDYSPAGDESWETVESRRLSSLSLGHDTPTKLLNVHETSLLLTSPPLLPTLPARSDISYTSPDPAALRRALDQLSPGFATPVRRPAHLRPARSGRDSASLEEMLKLSHAHKNAKADEDDWLLCDEGVSVSMRNEMAGVTTPWRTSVAGTLRKSQLGPALALDDAPAPGLEFLRAELELANARADKAEQDAEEQRDELARLHADEEALVEAAERKDAEVDQARKELKVALREKLKLEGEWDEERSRLVDLSRQPEDELRPDHTVEIALVRAAAAAERSVGEYERLLEDAKEEREAVRAAVEAIRVLAVGVGVWDSLVAGFAVTV